MLKLHVLASGSKGNASIVENTETGHGVLIDCGISKKAFFTRCDEAGFDPTMIDAVLITHEHIDHTKGLGVTLRGLAKLDCHPTVYVNRDSRAASTTIMDAIASVAAPTQTFQAESGIGGTSGGGSHAVRAPEGVATELSAAGIDIYPFATSHDAAASFGFRFEATGADGVRDALGFMTDTGVVTQDAASHLVGCRILALEGNHDQHMLETGPYPYNVKQRIASEFGHLSNDQGGSELDALLHNGLQQVVAMHISENNNTYDLPRDVFAEVLRREGHPASVACGYQHRLTQAE
jgi:phosphoribosyl 1,2-cyclic phosphodiesterase